MSSPDMIWYECPRCERYYTLADATVGGDCPRCFADADAKRECGR